MSNWGLQTKYGDYEIVGAREGRPRMLGKGSFGKTFEAVRVDTVAGQDIKEYVAIKVLDPALLTSAANRYQFIQELVALTKFKHSNLIHYIRCGEQNGEVYYAMELCQGGDLGRMSRRYGPLPEKIVALIGSQVASGLREVHVRHRLVHRDIKPSNIMLVDELESDLTLQYLGFRFEEQESLCRIVDFGLVDFTMNAQDAAQRFVGSPMYASPEQICEQPVDARSDIYSLGMTLWYLLQAKGPLLDANGDELKSMREAMVRHTLQEEHEKDFPRHISPEFRKILSKMVAKRAQQRYASASELQHALREYLTNPVTEAPREEVISITRLEQPLDSAFVLESALPSRLAHRSYVAVEKTSGQRVKLNTVADLQQNDSASVDALTEYLCTLAELSHSPALPPALFPVRNVILASDTLACTEDMSPHVALADVLRARANAKRGIGFAEAVTFLRPIAEALDFMLENSRDTVFLPCEEVWLTGQELQANPEDTQILIRPLSEWQDMQVHFSMMCLPTAPGEESESNGAETLSGSLNLSSADLHPVPTFVRLVYRTLNGSEVAAAAQFTPNAYVPAVTLASASNVLLRDLLCRQKPWTTVTAVLKDLCSNEGIPWRASPGRESASTLSKSDPGASGFVRPPQRTNMATVVRSRPAAASGSEPAGSRGGSRGTTGSVGSASPSGSTPVAGPAASNPAAGSAGSSGSVGAAGSARASGPSATGSAPPSGVTASGRPPIIRPLPEDDGPSAVDSLAGTIAGTVRPPGSSRGGSAFASINRAEASVAPGERERLCEIVSPGVVRSPYDPNNGEQQVPAEQWIPAGRVRCTVTQKYFRLPRKLDNLVARVVAPGVVQSPYAPPGSVQRVPWGEWIPGAKIVCEVSAKALTLPIDLPLPVGVLPPDTSGSVISPYDRRTLISLAPAEWEPGAEIVCPATQMTFVLPDALPPLLALFDSAKAGVFATPYSPTVTWQMPPHEWQPGRQVPCPVTQKPLVLPQEVTNWAAEATLVDAGQRLVTNPFRLGMNVEAPISCWYPGARITCPETGRIIVMPSELPPLRGDLVENRVGLIRSPYSGDVVQLGLNEWVAGAEVTCPKTRSRFVLPNTLPEWVGIGSIANLPAGQVKSPYGSFPTVDVPAAEWLPNQRLTCPETGRRFSLPAELPFLEGSLQPGHPGRVLSPFSSQWIDVALDDWKAREKIECPVGKRPFLLPANLEEWLVDGKFVPGVPGRIRSPLKPNPEVDVPAAQWQSGALVTCTATGRRFRIPADHLFPSLELERDAFQHALAEPDASPEAASEALARTHRGATPEQVQSIWNRHGLGTLDERLAAEETGEAIPDAPGFVSSPYGSHPRVAVAADQWANPSGRARCSETGRRFKLPGNLPPLVASGDPQSPGALVSPYAPSAPWTLPPEKWVAGLRVECPVTHHPLTLPPEVEGWPAEASLADPAHRQVNDPFKPGTTVQVPPASWKGGGRISNPAGRTLILPADLPPLVGELIEKRTGVIRSPYSGETIQVALKEWVHGASMTCPKTGLRFILPDSLPEWIAPGDVSGLPAGKVKSPYGKHPILDVAAKDWAAGQVLTCPETHRRFTLPEELPLLEGAAEAGSPGKIRSPFAGDLQQVTLDEWLPGRPMVCAATQRPFLLPAKLEEWIVDGAWAPGFPGHIRSPFLPHPEMEISAADWKAGGLLKCGATGRRFRIPAEAHFPSLELEKAAMQYALAEPEASPEAAAQALQAKHRGATGPQVQSIWDRHELGTLEARSRKVQIGEVHPDEPGFVYSPYGSRPRVEVPPVRWIEPHAAMRCPETGQRFLLPDKLPLLGARIVPAEPGMVISPFAPDQKFQINPEEWQSGHTVQCPKTKQSLRLPASLPAWNPQGRADENDLGAVFSPFGARRAMRPPASAWEAGGKVACKETGWKFELPANLPPLRATLAGTAGRVVSPYVAGGAEVDVSAKQWLPDGIVTCPKTNRPFRLPAELPPLPGELLEGKLGVIRSPYSGEPVQVPLDQWIAGAQIVCPKTRAPFTLPANLPEWVAPGLVAGLTPGKVKSPYAPCPVVDVSPTDWLPNQWLTCPATNRRFALPPELPLLEGGAKEGSPGRVLSPFSGEWQVVGLEEWKPGRKFECLATQRQFVLPANLEEWIVDGKWAAGKPGVIRSPFKPNPEVDITAKQWKAGGFLTCPATRRRFRIPTEPALPTLELEKAALEYGLARPGATEFVAAEALERDYAGATPALIQSIWDRHGIGTSLDRQKNVQSGEVVPDRPGVIRSPYGSHPTVDVPPAQWVVPHATIECPETGRPFVLPDELPPLFAQLVPDDPGTVVSPFAPEQPFQLSPDSWKAGQVVRCPQTAHDLQLPYSLPDWTPVGVVKENQPGTVFSPFGRKLAMKVNGADWLAGGHVTCMHSGYPFVLPRAIPPMVGTVAPGKVGRVVSPYAANCEVEVPHKQWVAGGQVICTQTGRPLLLPQTLPVWQTKGAPWKLIAAVVGLVVIAGAAWFLIPKTPTTKGSTPAPGGRPITSAPSGQSTWPQTIILRRGVEPDNASIFLAADGGKRVLVSADPTGVSRTIDLSNPKNAAVQAWMKQNDGAKEWRLVFEAPRYDALTFEASPIKMERGKLPEVYEIEKVVALQRERASVTWNGKDPFYSAVYTGIKFETSNPAPGERDPDPQPFGNGNLTVPTGEYSVTLVGRKGFSEDRVINPSLLVEKGRSIDLKLPPGLPFRLAGISVYKRFEVDCSAYGDRSATDLHTSIPAYLDFWTPTVVVFDPSFRAGRLIDENTFIGPNGFAILDTAVTTLARWDQKKSPGKSLKDYPGYTENKDALVDLFESLRPPDKINSSDVGTLLARRRKFFDTAAKIEATVEKRNLGSFTENNAAQVTDLKIDYQWLSKLRQQLDGDAWQRVVGAALNGLKGSAVDLDWTDVKALEQKVNVAGTDLGGVFIDQRFTIEKIDKDGRAHLSTRLLFVNPYDLLNPSPSAWKGVVERDDKTVKINEDDNDAGRRDGVFAPVEIKNLDAP